jgi:hypothetical protein
LRWQLQALKRSLQGLDCSGSVLNRFTQMLWCILVQRHDKTLHGEPYWLTLDSRVVWSVNVLNPAEFAYDTSISRDKLSWRQLFCS